MGGNYANKPFFLVLTRAPPMFTKLSKSQHSIFYLLRYSLTQPSRELLQKKKETN